MRIFSSGLYYASLVVTFLIYRQVDALLANLLLSLLVADWLIRTALAREESLKLQQAIESIIIAEQKMSRPKKEDDDDGVSH